MSIRSVLSIALLVALIDAVSFLGVDSFGLRALVDVVSILVVLVDSVHVLDSAVRVVVVAVDTLEEVSRVRVVEIVAADLLVLLHGDHEVNLFHQDIHLLEVTVVVLECARLLIALAIAGLGGGTHHGLSVTQRTLVLLVVLVGLVVVHIDASVIVAVVAIGSVTLGDSAVVVRVLRGVELQQSQ